MDILKYLDVLIGLAVVMVLLSPLVSAITQLYVWLGNMRAARLEVALTRLILQLNGNPYERFEGVVISGLTPGTDVTLGDVTGTANEAGEVTFLNDIPELLKAGQGELTFAPPLPQSAVRMYLPRGPVGDWDVTSTLSGINGVMTVKYAFPGPMQFGSRRATVTIPRRAILSAKMASGALSGTPLVVTAGPQATIEYPPNVTPVPATHDLELKLTDTANVPMAGQQVRLKFERNHGLDVPAPLPPITSLDEQGAKQIARAVLLHPMIAQPPFLGLTMSKRMRGEVIEREELIRVLLEFAAGEGPGSAALSADVRAALRRVLADNDIADPGRALAGIRSTAQQLEKSQPAAAAHVRVTTAILEAAPSAFVGKINSWFDQAMDRTITAYRFRTQLITIAAALVVALAIQMDSIDLLKKLATDDKLRNALVAQATEQQRRVEELTKTTTADRKDTAAPKPQAPGAASIPPPTDPKQAIVLDEIQVAKVRRDEIETNLAKLRDPSLAILPEHFIWQPLPEGSLMRIPDWLRRAHKGAKGDKGAEGEKPPKRLELVAGATTYAIEPGWPTDAPGDPLVALHEAINNAGTPVKARIEAVIKGAAVVNKRVRVTAGEKDLLKVDRHADGAPDGKSASVAKASLSGAKDCAVRVGEASHSVDCDLTKIVDKLGSLGLNLQASVALVLESRRNPPLQLRKTPGRSETNLLEGELKWKCSGWELIPLSGWLGPDWSDVCFDYPMLKQTWLGVLVTWMLLSLGAPFWYDALKNLLKLRSTLATKEEIARNERQADQTGTSKPATSK